MSNTDLEIKGIKITDVIYNWETHCLSIVYLVNQPEQAGSPNTSQICPFFSNLYPICPSSSLHLVLRTILPGLLNSSWIFSFPSEVPITQLPVGLLLKIHRCTHHIQMEPTFLHLLYTGWPPWPLLASCPITPTFDFPTGSTETVWAQPTLWHSQLQASAHTWPCLRPSPHSLIWWMSDHYLRCS